MAKKKNKRPAGIGIPKIQQMNLASLQEAAYNPRMITDKAICSKYQSGKKLGCRWTSTGADPDCGRDQSVSLRDC